MWNALEIGRAHHFLYLSYILVQSLCCFSATTWMHLTTKKAKQLLDDAYTMGIIIFSCNTFESNKLNELEIIDN